MENDAGQVINFGTVTVDNVTYDFEVILHSSTTLLNGPDDNSNATHNDESTTNNAFLINADGSADFHSALEDQKNGGTGTAGIILNFYVQGSYNVGAFNADDNNWAAGTGTAASLELGISSMNYQPSSDIKRLHEQEIYQVAGGTVGEVVEMNGDQIITSDEQDGPTVLSGFDFAFNNAHTITLAEEDPEYHINLTSSSSYTILRATSGSEGAYVGDNGNQSSIGFVAAVPASAIPEPSSIIILWCSSLVFLLRRNR